MAVGYFYLTLNSLNVRFLPSPQSGNFIFLVHCHITSTRFRGIETVLKELPLQTGLKTYTSLCALVFKKHTSSYLLSPNPSVILSLF